MTLPACTGGLGQTDALGEALWGDGGALPEVTPQDVFEDGRGPDVGSDMAPADCCLEVADVLDVVEDADAMPDEVGSDLPPPCAVDDDCEDGNWCTVDKCVTGLCFHQEKNCNDSNLCTDDWCEPETGLCLNEQMDCDDGNSCTWDSCMPTTGCQHEEIPDCCPGTVVSDEGFEAVLAWDVLEEFSPEDSTATWQVSGARFHSGVSSLYFGSPATMNYDVGGRIRAYAQTPVLSLPADVATHLKFWMWMELEPTLNYDTFTVLLITDDQDIPLFGKSAGYQMKKWKPVEINLQAFRGQEVAVRLVVDSIDGHDNEYEGVYVDDFQVVHMCPDEGCLTKVECNDMLVCTDGECVDGVCEYAITDQCCLNLGDCLDVDPCTLDACVNNVCDPVVLSPPYCCYVEADCDDENICTLDNCDASGICLHPPSQAPGCCDVNEDCDDSDPCTDNICNNDDSSCYFPFNATPCDDKNACTKNDKCIEGTCGGDDVVCSDGNNCTYDECNPQSGCYYPNIAQGEACDDLNPCTQSDVCLLGDCGGEWIDGCCLADPDCDDWDDCTTDKCSDENVCQNINICCYSDEECDDFDDVCTIDSCVDGACVYEATGVEGCCQGAIFQDDFSADLGWQYGNEWERGSASSSGGQSYGNPDPSSDHTDSGDNYVAGVVIGGNASTGTHDYYWLTSPSMSTQGAANLHLIFHRWLNSDYASYMVNAVEVYNGSQWVNVFVTGGSPGIQDDSWTYQDFDVTAHASSDFKVRFGFTIGSAGVFDVSSWNVDDVVVVDLPPGGFPGMCCEYNSDCAGIYPAGSTCSGGMCTVP